jgi:hypothetical protein
MVKQLGVRTPGQGLHDVTAQVAALVRQAGVDDGHIACHPHWEHRRRGGERELLVHVAA